MNSETPDTTGLIAGIIDVFAESPLSGNPLAVVEGWPADPQSWNRYAYVRNDPVNLTDPSGKFWGFLIHLFVALFHALGFLGAHLGHAFGVLGQAQVGTDLIQGGLMTSPTGPVISATVWTAEIPIYATSINWAAIAGYAGIGAAAAGGNGVGFLRDASKGLQTKIRRPKDCIYESICF